MTQYTDMIPLLNIDIALLHHIDAGLILGLHPANERHRYNVMPSLIGWVQT